MKNILILNNLPNIRNGAARLIPIKGTPTYIQNPNAVSVPMMAETTPNKPSSGLDLTQSVIIQVITQNAIINPRFIEKKGITELVFFSNSRSKVRDVNRYTSMSGNLAFSNNFRNASSHSVPLQK